MNNNVSKLIAALTILSACTTFAGTEISNDTVELPSYTVAAIDAMPILTKSSLPRVSSDLAGFQVTLKFTINAKGKPTWVKSASSLRGIQFPRERDFAVQMIEAVKHWKFEPARDVNGKAKALTVLLPIKVTTRENTTVVQASFKPAVAN